LIEKQDEAQEVLLAAKAMAMASPWWIVGREEVIVINDVTSPLRPLSEAVRANACGC